MTDIKNNIRPYQKGDLTQLMEIWLTENLNAHDFISETYWQANQAYVEAALPQADLYIYTIDNEIKAFAGIQDGYLAGIFVDKSYHRKGIGQELLFAVAKKYQEITLDVYDKNQQAINFYKKNNFKIIDRKLDEQTGEIEITMKNQMV